VADAPPCPNCESTRVWPIVWGMPGPEGLPPEHVVGGCCCLGDGLDPIWECQGCKHRFGKRGESTHV
jgi:hypothetical protein